MLMISKVDDGECIKKANTDVGNRERQKPLQCLLGLEFLQLAIRLCWIDQVLQADTHLTKVISTNTFLSNGKQSSNRDAEARSPQGKTTKLESFIRWCEDA